MNSAQMPGDAGHSDAPVSAPARILDAARRELAASPPPALALDRVQRALNLIGYAAEFEGYHLDSETAGQMRQWLFDLAPLVAADVAGSIAKIDVYLGVGSAAALLFPAVDEFDPDRISYTKMLAAQLSILLHRRQLLQRGEPLMRALTLGQIWRAADAAPRAYH